MISLGREQLCLSLLPACHCLQTSGQGCSSSIVNAARLTIHHRCAQHVIVVSCLALTPRLQPRSIVAVVDKCLEEDLAVFRATVQDIVDELEVRVPPWSITCQPLLPSVLL